MKQFFLTAVVVFLTGTMVYAQQASNQPTSAQTKQEAQQYLDQVKSNSSQFDSDLADIIALNSSNKDMANFNQLKAEIDRLETLITTERDRIKNNLDSGKKVSSQVLEKYERLINQHKAKLEELEAFVSG